MASFSSLLVFLFAAFFVRFAGKFDPVMISCSLMQLSKCIYSIVDSACTQHDIRLRNGPNAREGRIEYCYNNQWGTVCDDLFGTNDAKVVCSQLNYDANGTSSTTVYALHLISQMLWPSPMQHMVLVLALLYWTI